MTPQEWLDAYDKDAIHPRTIYDERASTIIRDLLAEVERLRENIEQLQVQLAGCGVAAMCNTAQSRGQQECVEGDYGWSQSYQDVVNVVGGEIALRDQLQAVQAENERLKEQVFFKCTSPVGLCPYVEDTQIVIKELQAENERLSALAATHLADQELLVGQERRRVVEEFREAIYYDSPLGIAVSGDVKAAAEYEKRLVAICKKYGVEG